MSLSVTQNKKRQPKTRPATVSCTDCGKVFETRTLLRKHISSVHKKRGKMKVTADEVSPENGETRHFIFI